METAQNLKDYKKRLQKALKNTFLRSAMGTFATAYKEAQGRIFAGVDLEGLRRDIARGKDEALPRLEELYQTFKARAEAAGVTVHLAATATEANRIIAGIATDNQVKKIVKSKSMTAEETFLNDHLEAEGLEVVETDLGEWIIQLRHEGPSHMVMPAIHLSRQEVADLFTKVTGQPQEADIGNLVKVARKELRKAFLEADMGISGANFAIADTGTLGIISNEGNARLTTTLPRVHVALVGIDKLVPDLHTALRILQVLPRRATGQVITSYVSWITGHNECRPAPGGKKEMHVVFLDNGRLALARDPVFKEALRCIRCGSCANVCPIYSLVGGHNYGHVYIGAIGLILTYFYHGRMNDRAIVQNCLNCQACKAVCPAGIDLPHLIKETYGEVLKGEDKLPLKNKLLRRVLKDRKLFHFILRRASLAQKPLTRDQAFIRHLPFFFGKEHGFRSLPAIARRPFRDLWPKLYQQVDHPRYRVALFGGCLVDFVYPEQAMAFLKALKGQGVQVEYPLGQTCCGLPAKMMAEKDVAREVALQNLAALDPANYDYIVTLCASCGSHLKEAYPKLLAGDHAAVKVEQFVDKLIDFSSFLTKVLKVQPERYQGGKKKVAYHSPCHLCRGLGVVQEPRDLLAIAGLEYLPARDEDVCCGMGGTYSTDFPEISAELLKKKLDAVEETGADLLVTDCPGCVLQLKGGMDKRGGKIEVKHIAEAVAEAQKE
uniref:4Fe-4S dicluster domain-containing protein n=1 Tax=Desulfobacca acetoxidans TaxID=60893 RepID=A0A7V6DQV7_9BACT